MNCWNDVLGIETEVPEPEPYVEEVVEPASCQCFANSPEWESWCEGDYMSDFAYGCVGDVDCHWGPMEEPDCAIMNDVLV